MRFTSILAVALLGACEIVEDGKTDTSPTTDADTDTDADSDADSDTDTDTDTDVVDADGDGSEEGVDCDDNDAGRFPGNPEVCDGVDNDCNKQVDDGVLLTVYADTDGDGFGDPLVSDEACEAFTGFVLDGTDCDDTRADVSPGSPEIYEPDVVDEDCSGAGNDMPEWHHESSIKDIVGPEDWAVHWPECGGTVQSPVDIDSSTLVPGVTDTLVSHWRGTTVSVKNNGHTIEFEYEAGSDVEVDGVVYTLKQFHFHAGSEHTIDGSPAPMEMHAVHVNDAGTPDEFDDTYVVVAFLIEEDPYSINLSFEFVGWSEIATLAVGDTYTDLKTTYSLQNLIPPGWIADGFPSVRYDGSLTTPPCSETVRWVVSDFPIYMSTEQVAEFTTLYSANFRDTQDLNGRLLGYGSNPL